MPASLIRIIIIDDEPVICQALKDLIGNHYGFSVVAVGHSVAEALALIPAFQPDLLLLDISLGSETGFDILEQLSPLFLKVIFVTGFDQYAIKAVKYGALDYILKPVDELELVAALQRAAASYPATYEQYSYIRQQYNRILEPERIILRESHLLHIVRLKEILYLQSQSGTTTFHMLDGQCIPVYKTISEYDGLLPASQFIRAHQSYLVNIEYIKIYHPEGRLVLQNGEQLPVSFRRREYVISSLSNNL